jgi:hypothetical protein
MKKILFLFAMVGIPALAFASGAVVFPLTMYLITAPVLSLIITFILVRRISKRIVVNNKFLRIIVMFLIGKDLFILLLIIIFFLYFLFINVFSNHC